MPPVRLGKMYLRWCNICDVPILESKDCPVCNSKTERVRITPPGDVRPAFYYDLKFMKKLLDTQFGAGCGIRFLPENFVVLLNHTPDIDRLDEVIFRGVVQGAIKFDLHRLTFRFLPRLSGAARFLTKVTTGYVIVDNGAVNPILTGSNVLAPGIVKASRLIEPNHEVLVLDQNFKLLGVGSAQMTGEDMLTSTRGLSVKIRWHYSKLEFEDNYSMNNGIENEKIINTHELEEIDKQKLTNFLEFDNQPLPQTNGWKSVLAANEAVINKRVKESRIFITETADKYNLKIAVSFSGGKDSLATLLLVMESGLIPSLLFIDTGLEFPETIEHVKEISKMYGLKLLTAKPSNAFWKGFEYFGPPGRDYRWCCKTSKLGPATRLIKTEFPEGVLTFIGQRRYESEQRSRKGNVWHNPWVPGQIGASPIQEWTALHIWLYIFSKDACFNILYEQGLERIGCWLCPASDMADLITISQQHPDYKRLIDSLKRYGELHNFSGDWLTYGLWRWRKLPKGIIQLMEAHELTIKKEISDTDYITTACSNIHQKQKNSNDKPTGTDDTESNESYGLELKLSDGFSDCKYGLSLEGVFNKELDIDSISNLLNILGEPQLETELGYCTVNDKIDIFPEGGFVLKGENPSEIKKLVSKVHSIIIRAMECVGCGICTGRCENNALYLDSTEKIEKVRIKASNCTHCGKCLGPCPVVNFNNSQEYEM